MGHGQSCLFALLAYLASDPAVLFVETYSPIIAYNQMASAIVQTGTTLDHTFDDVGLNGTGQVVQVRGPVCGFMNSGGKRWEGRGRGRGGSGVGEGRLSRVRLTC